MKNSLFYFAFYFLMAFKSFAEFDKSAIVEIICPQTGKYGNGVIVSQDGYVITAKHVIQNSDTVWVTIHKSEFAYWMNKGERDYTAFTAKVVSLHPRCDVALLKLPTDKREIGLGLPYINDEEFMSKPIKYPYIRLKADRTLWNIKDVIFCGFKDYGLQCYSSLRISKGSECLMTIMGSMFDIVKGMSGGPVLDAISGELIGILSIVHIRGSTGVVPIWAIDDILK
jgi:S1-C subfamily serine protease